MPARTRVLLLVLVGGLLLTLAVAWQMGPLDEYLEYERLQELALELADVRWLPLAVFGLVVLGQQLAVPQMLMTAAAVVLLGPVEGFFVALAGTLVGAVIGFAIGRWLGHSPFRRHGGRRMRRLSRYVGRRGVKSMVLVNLVPIGPHTLINLAAGTSHIRLRHFLLGTVLGITPLTAAVAALTHGLLAMEGMPDQSVLLLGMTLAVLLGAMLWMLSRRAWAWLARETEPRM